MIKATFLRRSAAPLLLGLSLCAMPSRTVQAAEDCLGASSQCDPDLLCTFRRELAMKVALYQAYLRNSQKTKQLGKRDTVRYNGAFYDASMSEARAMLGPTASKDALQETAGRIFQTKMNAYAMTLPEPTCSRGTVQDAKLPPSGYGGMETDANCRISVSYEAGDYSPEGFGSSHTTCKEFYERDHAHELIHQETCQKVGSATAFHIDNMIENEVKAYEHSVRLSKAYVELLGIRCSAHPTPWDKLARAAQLIDLLDQYDNRSR